MCACECSRAPDYITNIGFLGRWGTYACPQCLPSDIVPIRSWTRTLRPPGIRHRHLPYHAIPCTYHAIREDPAAHGHWCAFTDLYHTIPYHTMHVNMNGAILLDLATSLTYHYPLRCIYASAPPRWGLSVSVAQAMMRLTPHTL